MTVKLNILDDEPALKIDKAWTETYLDPDVRAGLGINPMTNGKCRTIAMDFKDIPESLQNRDWFGSTEDDPNCDYRIEIQTFDYNVDINRLYETVFQFLKGHIETDKVHVIDEENMIDYLLTDKQKELCGVKE